ncbi:unnamed protein product [Protopolystoma xenopodis]|uniref:Uncharacterized protein n=1 Tax=Protopolystoma xenopodis TaxID=117903 RepID=A0A448WQ73_9PLAT|nr:unnamed protein product [Protopolystoma xenopodis]
MTNLWNLPSRFSGSLSGLVYIFALPSLVHLLSHPHLRTALIASLSTAGGRKYSETMHLSTTALTSVVTLRDPGLTPIAGLPAALFHSTSATSSSRVASTSTPISGTRPVLNRCNASYGTVSDYGSLGQTTRSPLEPTTYQDGISAASHSSQADCTISQAHSMSSLKAWTVLVGNLLIVLFGLVNFVIQFIPFGH